MQPTADRWTDLVERRSPNGEMQSEVRCEGGRNEGGQGGEKRFEEAAMNDGRSSDGTRQMMKVAGHGPDG